jgi:hypothetical protein
MFVERKKVKAYPNNKPWVTPDLRKVIVNKHKSYGGTDYEDKQKLVNKKIKEAKNAHKV